MSRPDPWPFAGRVAGLVGGSTALESSYLAEHLAADLAAVVPRAAALVEEETGLRPEGRPEVVTVDRREWAERNVASFRRLLAPVEASLGGPGELASRLVGGETGVLLGLLSRRVLGQYELVLPGGDGDVIAFVAPNVLALERAHQLRPAELRLWVALHECAHRVQFLGVPWMREHFLGLVTELTTATRPGLDRVAVTVGRVASARRSGGPLLDERGLLGLVTGPDGRAALDRVQALMTVLEGHGHAVMNRLGVRLLVSQPRMASLLEARQDGTRVGVLLRLLGLDMKYRQYRDGERFVLEVERAAGWAAVGRVWESPESLPDLDEIAEPRRWLARVA